jgi:hypothetical protein
MESFFSLFHCDSFSSNRRYEHRFQFFVVSIEEDERRQVEENELLKLVNRAREDSSNRTVTMRLARFLGATLERCAYDLFIESIGPLETAIFYDDSAVNVDGFTDFEETKNLNYRKYCIFKFVSFLDLLQPNSLRWRGPAEIEFASIISEGLRRFVEGDLQVRTSILERWLQNPVPSSLSEDRAKRAETILNRRAFLLKLGDLPAAEIAKRLDNGRFKPLKFPSYTLWHSAKRQSFESWLSKERSESRRVWRRKPTRN